MGPLSGASDLLPVPEVPWRDVIVDLITGLPLVKGYNAVCMVVDRFSKEIIVLPPTNTVLANQLA